MTLDEFKNLVHCTEIRKANTSQDYCDWYYKDIHIFHERIDGSLGRMSYKPTPAQLFHLSNSNYDSSYWGETTYTDLELAKSDAKKYNARVQQGWYCEAPDLHWFLIFNDLDKAIEQAYDELKKVDRL
jgi:hypothetical protein